ncbi:mitochondrial amino-acid acetyltransferase [Bisporella sp. PMI_857]|nr:mitochondrial amino-acid acetyltransferase [Bisporella sp. PMI_857]
MNLQNLAFKKGKEAAGHNIQSWTRRGRRLEEVNNGQVRHLATVRPAASHLRDELTREHVRDLSSKQKAKKEAKALDRDFFISVLGSSATKRDAKAYIQRFMPPQEKPLPKPSAITDTPVPISHGNEVNLGGFYGNARAVQDSPKFVQQPETQAKPAIQPQLHIALVKIRAPESLHDETLKGIGRTISQLNRLGLTSVVVVECSEQIKLSSSADLEWRSNADKQANRIVAAFDGHGGARLVNSVIGIFEEVKNPGNPAYHCSNVHVTMRELLMKPLRRGLIPVIPCTGYIESTHVSVSISANEVVLALTREFAGVASGLPDEAPSIAKQRRQSLPKEVSLDRLIILDPLGGIPASDRENGYHVFLNMEQEFESAKQDLARGGFSKNAIALETRAEQSKISELSSSNPSSKLVDSELGSTPQSSTVKSWSDTRKNEYNRHMLNLELVRSVLAILPPSSSALLTTPDEAANSGKQPDIPFQAAGVGTRRQRNPLIHNLLTDKPIFSSSLPVGRLGPVTSAKLELAHVTPTTFAKHGMPVSIFPDPRITPWEPPRPGKPNLTLTDSHIDLPRLVHLIEDSFGRKLDVQDYLKRVNHRIAGVIIAGEYEGGALLTWETPPDVVDDGSLESRARMVPYLDKFAVLKRSQGSGGTADVVFKAMVRDCFPQGVCWRSRKTNVVNKWYFERSRGTWKLPDTGWTMFWTTPDLTLDPQRFRDYEGVCRNIEPSWADNKAVLD